MRITNVASFAYWINSSLPFFPFRSPLCFLVSLCYTDLGSKSMIKSRKGKNQACFLEKRSILEVSIFHPQKKSTTPSGCTYLHHPFLSRKQSVLIGKKGNYSQDLQSRVRQTMTKKPILLPPVFVNKVSLEHNSSFIHLCIITTFALQRYTWTVVSEAT